MFCSNCGNNVPDGIKFCPECGHSIRMVINNQQTESRYETSGQPYNNAPTQPYGMPNQPYGAQNQPYGTPNPYGYQQPYGVPPQYANPNAGNVDFVTAIKIFFAKYSDFSGRASKSEFWWSYLFCFLVGLIPYVGWVASLALIVPSIACAVRRLHDTGKEGTYYLMCLIPIVGIIILIYQWCQDSEGDNIYGPMPR